MLYPLQGATFYPGGSSPDALARIWHNLEMAEAECRRSLQSI